VARDNDVTVIDLLFSLRNVSMSHNKHQQTHSQAHPTDEEAQRRCAYSLWEQAGRPEGESERFWREAEEQIAEQQRATTARPH